MVNVAGTVSALSHSIIIWNEVIAGGWLVRPNTFMVATVVLQGGQYWTAPGNYTNEKRVVSGEHSDQVAHGLHDSQSFMSPRLIDKIAR
ncbi:hypothetical protein ACHAQJ_004863 [Trichoderma viride]